eukprot:scaffold1729_cov173-Ochromonas_danica.AAC.5
MLDKQDEEEKQHLDEKSCNSSSTTSFTPFHHTISMNEYDDDHHDHPHHHHNHNQHPGIMIDWKSQPRKESFLSSSLTDEDDENHHLDNGDDMKHKKRKSFLPVSFLYSYYSIVFTMMIPALPALTLHLTHDNSSHAAYLYESLHYVNIKKKNSNNNDNDDDNRENVRSEEDDVTSQKRNLNPFTPIIIHFTNPVIRKLSYPLVLSSLTQGLGFIWYIYMEGRYHSSTTLISVYLAFFGVVSLVVQGFLIKRLIPHPWNEKKAAMIGYFLQGLQYVGYGVVPRVWGLFVMALIFAVGLIADPALKALIVKASLSHQPERSKEIQGNLQGALSGLRTICTALGALFFPAVYSYCLDTNDSLIFLPFLIGALCFFFAALVLYCQSDHSMPFHTPLDHHNQSSSSVDYGKDYAAVDIEESLLGVDRLDDPPDYEESDALDKVVLLDPTGQVPTIY